MSTHLSNNRLANSNLFEHLPIFIFIPLFYESNNPMFFFIFSHPFLTLCTSHKIISTNNHPYVIARDGNGAGQGRVSLSHTHLRKKKFNHIPIPKLNSYQIFVPSPSPPGNEYNLVLIPVPVFLLL